MSEETPATKDTAIREVERELAFLFRRGKAISWRIARQVHPDLELDAYGLLVWLSRSDTTRLTELAKQLGLSKGTLSRQIHSLETLGLVDRCADPVDGRASLLALSAQGRQRLDLLRAARTRVFYGALGDWDEEDLRQLAGLLHRLSSVGDSAFAQMGAAD